MEDRVTEIRTHGAVECLNSTMVSEHLTSILSHELLSNPRHLKDAPDEARRLWEWHALEEIEHKAVAFDTWAYATRDWSPLRRWLSRSKMMLIRSEEHTSELQSLMRISYAVFCLTKKNTEK